MHSTIFTRQITYFLLFVGFLAGMGSVVYAQQARVVVGTVNGETIWLDDVMQQVERLPAEFQKAPIANYFDQLVADIVDARIAANEARAFKYHTKESVASAMKIAADRILAESWLGEKVSTSLSDESIQQAYETFVADTASRQQVTASHILVATEEESKEVIALLESGEDFSKLAKTKSTGPSGPNGGSLGTFGRGQMVPAFENAAFELNDGSFTKEPVQTQFGWHVIKVEQKTTPPAPTIDVIREQLVQTLSTQALGRILEGLRAKQDIKLRSFADIRNDAMAVGMSTK
ncbi:peptidylprolyl isomerase [Candidatus Puniceispirillum sp.]|nr:peptidylprolyl isomerase [Candidatus Puniceispirillum sp.]